MAIFSLQHLLNGLKTRETRPADFASAVLRLSAREQQAKEKKDEIRNTDKEYGTGSK